ncbi:MAG: hypothetical protein QM755_04845 [Luteolibacter sp.]
MFRRSSDLLILAAAMLLAGWLGYRQALPSPSAPASAATEAQRRASTRSVETGTSSAASRSRDRNFISRSITRWGDSDERWNVISGYSEAQIKAAVEKVAKNRYADGAQQLISMLYFRWGQLNPQAAVASEERHGFNDFRSTWTAGHALRISPATLAWMAKEPNTAIAAALDIQLEVRQSVSDPLPEILHPRNSAPPPPPPTVAEPDPSLDPFAR